MRKTGACNKLLILIPPQRYYSTNVPLDDTRPESIIYQLKFCSTIADISYKCFGSWVQNDSPEGYLLNPPLENSPLQGLFL
jgi:hypothetical protein